MDHQEDVDDDLYETLLALQKANFELRQENEQLQREKHKLHESVNILMFQQTDELGDHHRRLCAERALTEDAEVIAWCRSLWVKISTREKLPRLFVRTMIRLRNKQKI